MSKIRDTLAMVQSGARNNKYRLLFPLFGQEIDILCHASSNPGREMGTVEVYLKGRKYTMAGDMSDESSWTITIYNTQDFLVRNFFLKVIAGIQNFNTPITLDDEYSKSHDIFSGFNYSGAGSNLYQQESNYNTKDFLDSIGMGDLTDAMETVNIAYNEMRNLNNINIGDNPNSFIQADGRVANHGLGTAGVYNGDGNYAARPWYMTDIIIQQLDHNDNPISETRLNNAFATAVGGIDYTDEVGEISTTEITFAFSGIEYGASGVYVKF